MLTQRIVRHGRENCRWSSSKNINNETHKSGIYTLTRVEKKWHTHDAPKAGFEWMECRLAGRWEKPLFTKKNNVLFCSFATGDGWWLIMVQPRDWSGHVSPYDAVKRSCSLLLREPGNIVMKASNMIQNGSQKTTLSDGAGEGKMCLKWMIWKVECIDCMEQKWQGRGIGIWWKEILSGRWDTAVSDRGEREYPVRVA